MKPLFSVVFAALLLSSCGTNHAQAPPDHAPQSAPSPRRLPTLEATKVSFSMRGNEEDYRKCFMRAINSRGAVQIGFVVDPRGSVDDASVSWSSINNPTVEQCLINRIHEQRFGEQSAPTRGDWTFVFRLTDPIDDDDREELLKEAEERDESSFELLPHSRGTIDGGHVDEMIQLRYPLYAHCYRDSIRRRGESRGLVRFRLEIDENGRLTDLQDAGSVLPDAFAVDCMAEAFYAIDFPKPSGGPVSIRYGLDFQ